MPATGNFNDIVSSHIGSVVDQWPIVTYYGYASIISLTTAVVVLVIWKVSSSNPLLPSLPKAAMGVMAGVFFLLLLFPFFPLAWFSKVATPHSSYARQQEIVRSRLVNYVERCHKSQCSLPLFLNAPTEHVSGAKLLTGSVCLGGSFRILSADIKPDSDDIGFFISVKFEETSERGIYFVPGFPFLLAAQPGLQKHPVPSYEFLPSENDAKAVKLTKHELELNQSFENSFGQ